MKNIDFKEILREVRPYILYIPHPAAPIVYQLLSFLCDQAQNLMYNPYYNVLTLPKSLRL